MPEPRYRLVVAGELSVRTGHAFEGMSLTLEDGNTVIEGPVRDQAQLQAVLQRVSSLGLTLLSAAASEGPPGSEPETGGE